MGFYEQIGKYYDFIFPVGEEQLKFIKESAGMPEKRILDVACGSGGYAVELAAQGYIVTAADLEEEMVNKAREKAELRGVDMEVRACDMRELSREFSGRNFDSIFCIGNSIVHLGSLAEISGALGQMHRLLNKGGSLVLQIMNYDRIMKFKVSGLPTIKNDGTGLEFIRRYEYEEKRGLILFNTTLTVKEDGRERRYENSIELLPVRFEELKTLLRAAGFENMEFFGDFKAGPYDINSYMLVARAVK